MGVLKVGKEEHSFRRLQFEAPPPPLTPPDSNVDESDSSDSEDRRGKQSNASPHRGEKTMYDPARPTAAIVSWKHDENGGRTIIDDSLPPPVPVSSKGSSMLSQKLRSIGCIATHRRAIMQRRGSTAQPAFGEVFHHGEHADAENYLVRPIAQHGFPGEGGLYDVGLFSHEEFDDGRHDGEWPLGLDGHSISIALQSS
jgi:hypothetical protein